ncbi:Polygalacturonase QRT3 [Sesbania bispinosa]|nr:Polygalacturonase QRT3 [Sesbania bispinosa]
MVASPLHPPLPLYLHMDLLLRSKGKFSLMAISGGTHHGALHELNPFKASLSRRDSIASALSSFSPFSLEPWVKKQIKGKGGESKGEGKKEKWGGASGEREGEGEVVSRSEGFS